MTRAGRRRCTCCGRPRKKRASPRRRSMPEPQSNAEVRREPSDASLKWVLLILAAGILAAVLIHWGTWGLFEGFQRRIAAGRQPGHALSPGPAQPEPREPRLEQVDRMAGRAPDAADATSEWDP